MAGGRSDGCLTLSFYCVVSYGALQAQYKQEEEACQRLIFETLEKVVANKTFIQQNLSALNKVCSQIKGRISHQTDLFLHEQQML